MQPAYLEIALVKGDCYSARFEPRFGPDQVLGDFTGHDGQVGFSWAGGSILLEPGSGVTMGVAWIDFDLTKTQTALLPDGQQSEIKITVIEPSGCPVTLAAGPVTAKA